MNSTLQQLFLAQALIAANIAAYHAATLTTPTTNSQLTWRGEYSSSNTYAPNDLVSFAGSSYINLLASTNLSPRDTTSWGLFASGATSTIVWRGNYNNLMQYHVGDVVYHNGSSYICTAIVVGEAPSLSDKWQIMTSQGAIGLTGAVGQSGAGLVWRGTYASSLNYSPNDIVVDNGSSYICIVANTGMPLQT